MKRKPFAMVPVLVLLALALFGCGRFMTSDVPYSGGALSPQASSEGRARVFVGFKTLPGPAEEALIRALGGEVLFTYHIVPAIAASLPEQALEALRRNPNVAYVEPDGLALALGELDNAWGVKRIGAGLVHAAGNTGRSIKVAVLDTGVDYTHPDLSANYCGGWDFVNNDPDPMDDRGHGTHVTGTIAALLNGVGVVGVAPDAQIYALKVLGSDGKGYWSWVIAALDWCVQNGIQVANMSLGGSSSTTLEQACNRAYAAGVLLVAAAGNSGPGEDTVLAPARYDAVIAVSATDSADQLASFSSTGPAVELAAPGVSIRSTLPGGSYGTASGTSMASPHVAGTAALVWAANPTWTNVQVRQRLRETAEDLGTPGWDPQFGHGLVNAAKAASGGTATPTGSLTVVKTVVGEAPATAWEFSGTAPLGTFTLPPEGGSRTWTGLPAQSYTLTETTKANYTVGYRVNGGPVQNGNSVTVILGAGESVTVEFINTYTPPLRVGVKAIEMGLVAQNKNFTYATATVRVVDEKGNPVSGATVSGTWSGAVSGTVLGTTDVSGKVVFNSPQVRRPPSGTTFVFTVTNIAKTGCVYDPALNAETSDQIRVP